MQHNKQIAFSIINIKDETYPSIQPTRTCRIQVINPFDGSEFFCEVPKGGSDSCGGFHRLLLERFEDELFALYEDLVPVHHDLCNSSEYIFKIQQFIVECAQLDNVHKSDLWISLPELSDFFKTLYDAVNAFKVAPETPLAVHLGIDRDNSEMNFDYVEFYKCFVAAQQNKPTETYSEIMSSAVRAYFELHEEDNIFLGFALDYAISDVGQGVMMSFFQNNIDAIYSECTTAPFMLDSNALYGIANKMPFFSTEDYEAAFKTVIDVFNDSWSADFILSSNMVLDYNTKSRIISYLKDAIASLPRFVPDFMIQLFNTEDDVLIAKRGKAGSDDLILRTTLSPDVFLTAIESRALFFLHLDRTVMTKVEPFTSISIQEIEINKDEEALILFRSFIEIKDWMTPQEVEANFSTSLRDLMDGAQSSSILKSVKLVMDLAMNPNTEPSRELVVNEAYFSAVAISLLCEKGEADDKKETLLALQTELNGLVLRIKTGDIKSGHVEWMGKHDAKELVVQRFINNLVMMFNAQQSLANYFSTQTECASLLDILPETTPKEMAQKKAYRILFDLLKIVILKPEEAAVGLTTLVNGLTTLVDEIQTFEFQNARALLIVGLNRFEFKGYRTLLRGLELKVEGMAESVEKESAAKLLITLIRIANKEMLYIDGVRVAGKYGAVHDNGGKGDCFYLALADAARVAVSNGGTAQWGTFDNADVDAQRGRRRISTVMEIKLANLCSLATEGEFESFTLLETPENFGADFRLMVQLLTSFKLFTEEMVRKYSNVINIPGSTTPYAESVRDFERFERPMLTWRFEALFKSLLSADVSVFYNEDYVGINDAGSFEFTDVGIRNLLPFDNENCSLHRMVIQKLNEQVMNVRAIFPTLDLFRDTPGAQEMNGLHPATALGEAFNGLSYEPVASVLVQDSFLMALCNMYAMDILLTPTYYSALKGPLLETIFPDDTAVIDLNNKEVVNHIVGNLFTHMPKDDARLTGMLGGVCFQLYEALDGGVRLFDEVERQTVLKPVITPAELRFWFRQQTFVKWAESPEVTVATSINEHVEVSIQQNHGIVVGSIHAADFVQGNLGKKDTLRVMKVGQHYVALDIRVDASAADNLVGGEVVAGADSGHL